MSRRTNVFALICISGAFWSGYLVWLHHQAVAHLLMPGLLCGPEGGCEAVLASEYATLLGVAVSAPAVPMFAGLALLGLLAGRDRVEPARVAGLGTLAGLFGLAFGGWLLFQMRVSLQAWCPYCLILDGLTLSVTLSAASLHPAGWRALPRELGRSLMRFSDVGPELALLTLIVLGTGAITLFAPDPQAPIPTQVEVALTPNTPSAPALPPPTKPTTARSKATTRRVVLPANPVNVPIANDVPVRGPADAPVTLVLFEDFQCPFCGKLAASIEALRNQRDDVRIAFVHFPMHSACNDAGIAKDMHPFACGAAAAAICAQAQGQFWGMHDALFHNSTRLRTADLRAYAADLGLDLDAFAACQANPATLEKIRADTRLGKQLGVSGTPTFFVNGRRLAGGQPVEVLSAVVDAVKSADSGRILLDVPLQDEQLGEVSAPSEVRVLSVTIDAFEAHLQGSKAVSSPGVLPTQGLSWYQADAACRAASKRLCTEAEWLTACTGTPPVDRDGDGVFSDERVRGRAHPYGAFQQPSWCASSRTKDDPRPLTTGVHPRCATPEGVYDLEGGLKEWVGTRPNRAALKGGSYYSGVSARCAYFKDAQPPDTSDTSIGFRCCQGPPPPDDQRFSGGRVGDTLMDWSLPTASGQDLGSATLRGKPIILTFWASWCGPCRKELPALAAAYLRYQAQGLQVVGVNVDKDPAAARRFLKANPMPFPIVLDTDSALMDRFDTRGVPTTFWVRADGHIRQRSVGYDAKRHADFEASVQALLAP